MDNQKEKPNYSLKVFLLKVIKIFNTNKIIFKY